ncbi:MAG: HD domain-containing protein [archaeon]
MIPSKTQAIEILNKYVKLEANLTHNLYVGYGMQGIAKYLNKSEEEQNLWFVVGALHDIDIECYGGKIEDHTIVGEKLLQTENIDKGIIESIKSHNEILKIERTKDLEHALYSIDGLSGIIRAYVLMRPDKDIKAAEAKSVIKKFKDKFFAAAVSREQISLCEKTLNIEVNKFIEIVFEEIKKCC